MHQKVYCIPRNQLQSGDARRESAQKGREILDAAGHLFVRTRHLDISTIGQQFQHFFVTLRAPVLHLSFAFHFAFVCRLEIYEAPSTVFAQRGE